MWPQYAMWCNLLYNWKLCNKNPSIFPISIADKFYNSLKSIDCENFNFYSWTFFRHTNFNDTIGKSFVIKVCQIIYYQILLILKWSFLIFMYEDYKRLFVIDFQPPIDNKLHILSLKVLRKQLKKLVIECIRGIYFFL